MNWPVVPLCKAQLTDVNPTDILYDGLYRRCNVYKGGGGYDKFPEIYQKRFGERNNLNSQFVVQLRGCPLRCPYCYVTQEGIWGKPKLISTDQLVEAFRESKCEVFHLMGGAPALYIEHWMEIIEQIPDKVFHSDLLLQEKEYDTKTIIELGQKENCLYAVSIKGTHGDEFRRNTGKDLNRTMFWKNLDTLVHFELPFYFTFTGMSENSIAEFKHIILDRYGFYGLLDHSFAIEIIRYNALDYIGGETSA